MSPSQCRITGCAALVDQSRDRPGVGHRRLRPDRREGAGGHQDHLPARRLDRLHLVSVGGDGSHRRWSGRPAAGGRCPHRRPRAGFIGWALAAPIVRSISSSAVGQSTPMPRCAVSIASARSKALIPEPAAEGQRRLPVHRRAGVPGVPLTQGSLTTWAAAKAVRVSGTLGARGTSGVPVGDRVPACRHVGRSASGRLSTGQVKDEDPVEPAFGMATRAAPTRR